ncbi:YidB family protein [Uliginosibacterium sp. H3]|uniref:YidB family protein n=1 Tax=Uliginosibacterium silvisoli TaxID=3114758 RepID=A0ABU6K4Z3_9RHOO|nr:YidB family protein [Uliginosibacterium sp. H3]
MSLFGQLAEQALGALAGSSAQNGQNPLIQIAGSLLQQQGGITGLLEKFNSAGLGEQMSSWISTGDNLPVDGAQISDALGHGTIADIAGKLGLPADQISGGLAQMLPQLIDKMTPDGSTGGSNDLLEQGLGALGALFNQPRA